MDAWCSERPEPQCFSIHLKGILFVIARHDGIWGLVRIRFDLDFNYMRWLSGLRDPIETGYNGFVH
jgi:hypothetical protein